MVNNYFVLTHNNEEHGEIPVCMNVCDKMKKGNGNLCPIYLCVGAYVHLCMFMSVYI